MRRLGFLAVAGIALLGAGVPSGVPAAETPAAFMSCGFPPTSGPYGGSKGEIDYRQQPESCHYSGDGSGNDLIILVDVKWENWGQAVATATGNRQDTHDQDRNGFQRHPVEIAVKGLQPAVGDTGESRLYYTRLEVTFEDGKTYYWSLYRPGQGPVRLPGSKRKPQKQRTCGVLPGDGAYSYIQTWGIRCAPAYRIAFRARKRFCKRRNDCLNNPPVSISHVYRGKVRYRGWSCKVTDGWELTRVHCRKRKMRLIYRSAA